MSISEDIQKLSPGAIIELYELDTTPIGGSEIDRFHSGLNGIGNSIIWDGNSYTQFPLEATGFEMNGQGQSPRPTIQLSNIGGVIGAVSLQMGDLLDSKLTRIRTFARYLDAVNFPGGVNPDADPNAILDIQVFYVDRKSGENKIFVEYELAAASDLVGVKIPLRQVITNVCPWKYRSPECSYTGPPVADTTDSPTDSPTNDRCGKRITSCKLRFGSNSVLPYGGFPGSGISQ